MQKQIAPHANRRRWDELRLIASTDASGAPEPIEQHGVWRVMTVDARQPLLFLEVLRQNIAMASLWQRIDDALQIAGEAGAVDGVLLGIITNGKGHRRKVARREAL